MASGAKLNFVYITNDLSSSYTAAQKAGVDKAVADLGRRRRAAGAADRGGPGPGVADPDADRAEEGRRHRRGRGQRRLAQAGDPAGVRCGHPVHLRVHRPAELQAAGVHRRRQHRRSARSSGPRLADELAGKTGKVVARLGRHRRRLVDRSDGRHEGGPGDKPGPGVRRSDQHRHRAGADVQRDPERDDRRTPARSRSPRSTAAASTGPPSGSRPPTRAARSS